MRHRSDEVPANNKNALSDIEKKGVGRKKGIELAVDIKQ